MIESTSEATWIPVVRQLYTFLKQNDARLDLLREIDRGMDDAKLPLEEFISKPIQKLLSFTNATKGYFYLFSGDNCYLFAEVSSEGGAKSVSSEDFLTSLDPDFAKPTVIETRDSKPFSNYFPESESILLVPVLLSQNVRFGVVVLETDYIAEASAFRDEDIRKFAHTVIKQLALGIEFRLRAERTRWKNELVDAFFALDLEPNSCFRYLASHISDYLPSYGPFAFKFASEVQVLIYHSSGNYLTIQGTTGQEAIGTKIKVEESVVGLLFEHPERQFVLGDPFRTPELKSRYKAYLGKEKGKEIRAELAIPIEESGGRRIAAINFESEHVNVFRTVHIEAVLSLCQELTAIISSLYERLLELGRQQQAVLYAQRSYWNTTGSILRHNTRSQLLSIRFSLDNAMGVAGAQHLKKLEEILTPAYENIMALTQEIESFAEELHSYTIYGKFSIRTLISQAIAKIERQVDKTQRVRVRLLDGPDFNIFCSPLLKMHVYNLIDNSIHWVEMKMEGDPSHRGEITLTVKPGPNPSEDQEIELNKTCQLIIEDNGSGCPPAILNKLFQEPISLRRTEHDEPGMGVALYSLGNHIQTIGGSVQAESVEGEWFRVTMNLPVFDPRIHHVRGFADR